MLDQESSSIQGVLMHLKRFIHSSQERGRGNGSDWAEHYKAKEPINGAFKAFTSYCPHESNVFRETVHEDEAHERKEKVGEHISELQRRQDI